MARIGFIGLGNIGGSLAKHLLEDGHELSVHDTQSDAQAALVSAGAHAAQDAGDVARNSEMTLLSLPTPDVVNRVATDWLDGAPSGSLLVDLSTNSPARVRALAGRLRDCGCEFIDAPLTGGAMGARDRTLVFMVGGSEKAFERVEPILSSLGRATLHMGELGAGMTAKLVNSCVAFTTTCASLEALALGAKAGLDLRALVELVRLAGAGNFYIDRAVEGIGRRGVPTEFALELAAKDAGLILDLARENGLPMPLASGAAQTLVTAVGAGLGQADWSELPAVIERQGDLAFELAPASQSD
jgi:3-hydroxyisobutyrate dehydrogenase-like beta-hydroxyacid dehydrogenase